MGVAGEDSAENQVKRLSESVSSNELSDSVRRRVVGVACADLRPPGLRMLSSSFAKAVGWLGLTETPHASLVPESLPEFPSFSIAMPFWLSENIVVSTSSATLPPEFW
jgi:hypothetical protein